MSNSPSCLYEFGPYRLDLAGSRLLKQGKSVSLSPKVYELLVVLVEHNDRLLEKEELIIKLWPDTFVEENNLAVHISLLRKTLGEHPDGSKYIETVPKRGYRFIAEVNRLREETELIIERQVTTNVIIEQQIEEFEEIDKLEEAIELVTTRPVAVQTNGFLASGNGIIAVLPESRVTTPLAAARPKRGIAIRTRTLVISLLALSIVATYGFWRLARPDHIDTISNVKSIAVLPFRSLGTDPIDESLSLGMADALITRLSNFNQITVRPTNAIIRYTDNNQDPLAAGRTLGVQALIDGRIQRVGDQVRVTVQLLRVQDGSPLWAESFEAPFTHIFQVQNSISEKAAQSLLVKLTETQRQRMLKRYTDSAEAYQAYLKGRYFWNKRTEENLKKALDYFNQAIEIDPTFALAYSGIADCYVVSGTTEISLSGVPNGEAVAKAAAAAKRALELDDSIAEAHTSLAATLAPVDDAAAHREFERAIELNSNYATAYSYYTIDLIGDNRLDEALSRITRAQEIDPLSVPINTNVGAVYYRRREYNKAIEQLKKTIDLDSNSMRAHWLAGCAYEQLGEFDSAIAELQKAITISNGGPVAIAALGHAYAVSGRPVEARKVLEQLQELSQHRYVSSYYVATIYIGLGEYDQAFDWLDKALANHELALLKVDQHLDPIRNDPRFMELIRRHDHPE